MKKILVPTDFSASANNALDAAFQLAKTAHSEIIVIHVLELVGPIYGEFGEPGYDVVSVLSDQAEQEMTKLKQRMLTDDKISINTAIYNSFSSVYLSIIQACEEHHAELIVMGTRGAGKIQEKLWGSQTSSVIGKSSVPVLAVPIDYHWKKPERVLLATNHFEKDQASCQFLIDIHKLFGAMLHVVVFTDSKKDKAVTAISHNWDINRYREFLDGFFQEYVTTEHLYGEDFEESLTEYISLNNIDLLTMFTYKRSFLDGLLNPSKTKHMSFHTKIPLLAIPVKRE